MPEIIMDPDAWKAFAGVVGILTFLAGGAVALKRLGIIGGRADAKPEPSPEAMALIEATQALLRATEAIAARSEALGRIHSRLDEQRDELGRVTSEVAHVKGELTAINRVLHLIQDHLLNKK